jgi:glycosyltransferase involved in cell wall biosynthesis
MRVLFVTGEFPPQTGGVGDYTDRLAGALTDQGHDIGVLTTASDVSGAGSDDRHLGDTVWANRKASPVWRGVRRWNLLAWRTIASRIRLWRPDVVHFQYQAAAYGLKGAVALYPWLLRVWNIRPLSVVTFHDLLPPHSFPLSGRLGVDRRAVDLLGRGTDAVIATNADDACRLLRLRARRVWEIPIGANIPIAPGVDRQAVRAGLDVGPDAPLLAYFGFYNAGKGLDELLTAFAALAQERPDARLLLIGGGAGQTDQTNVAYAEHLRRGAQEASLADRIIRTGYVDAAGVSAYLQAADVVVLPYRDGISLRRGALMAALSHSCAVVSTTPRSPMPDLERAMILSRVNDAVDLLRAIRQGLDPAVQERLRTAARTIAAKFTWESIAAGHTAAYRALCYSEG